MIDKYTKQLKPLATDLGHTAQAYAERIISRLDAIHEAVESEDFHERRNRVTVTGAVGTQNDVSSWSNVVSVPVGQEWELELFNLYVPGAGGGMAAIAIDGLSVLTTNVAAGSVGASQVGANLHLYGGDSILVFLSATSTLYMQFKVRRKISKRGSYAGDVVREPDRLDSRQEAQLDRRHFSTSNLSAGVNSVGQRPAEADNVIDAMG